MSPYDLVRGIEENWRKEFSQVQIQTLVRKIDRFTEEQRDKIFDWLLENCKFAPKVPDIFDAARELNLLERQARSNVDQHEWHKTNCRLCGGEGRLQVWRRTWAENGYQHQSLTKIYPYAAIEAMEHKPEPGEYSFIYRCSCQAGDAATLPEKWPKWSGDVHPSYLKTREAQQPTRADLMLVKQIAGTARNQLEPRGGEWLERQDEQEELL